MNEATEMKLAHVGVNIPEIYKVAEMIDEQYRMLIELGNHLRKIREASLDIRLEVKN
jgi:sulfur transfer protein SufE